MVTDLEFFNAIRSYNYRTRLFEGMNDLEEKIFDYMKSNNLANVAVNGYYVDISDGGISIVERPPPNVNQLDLELYTDSDSSGYR